MVRKKIQVKPIRNDLPIYPISVAAKLLNVHPRTLRIYESEGLVKPARTGSKRLYSPNDITWIGCLRKLIHDEGISIPGIRKLLKFATCYEIGDCPEEIHGICEAVVDRAVPRSLRLAGDPVGEMLAKEKDREIRARALAEKGTKTEKKRKIR
ncbi:MerR family transcriptional regulator [Desulfomarina sp.]